MSESRQILNSPRMSGDVWLDPETVTQEERDAWPVWEFAPGPENPPVVHPQQFLIAGEPQFGSWGKVRPLRLPGMNELGEIHADNMTFDHLRAVEHWQWLPWSRNEWVDIDSKDVVDVGLGRRWRPALFGRGPRKSTLGDTMDEIASNGTTQSIRACNQCPCCYTPLGKIVACSADPEIQLENSRLHERHKDCPMAGETRRWPRQ